MGIFLEVPDMHMADALISPAVGGVMLAAAAGVAAFSLKKNQDALDNRKIPLMGVMGAFVFAAQMINFTIPGTGSSGHIGGGILLAALLGPYAGFLTIAAVLLIQALFFGDGGLLAYGCNLFNMGFLTCFVAYPLIYRGFTRRGITAGRLIGGSVTAVVAGLQLGAFAVVLETLLSGKTELPFGTFVLFMQPIHLAIGLVEGLVTAAVLSYVWKARPELVDWSAKIRTGQKPRSLKPVLVTLLVATLLVGGLLSWFASAYPDGLEWAINRTTGSTSEPTAASAIHRWMAWLQEKTAIFPDYALAGNAANGQSNGGAVAGANAGTSVAGLAGGGLTLLLAAGAGFLARWLRRRRKRRGLRQGTSGDQEHE
jgi:cobalt/nickel transport system permease protein